MNVRRTFWAIIVLTLLAVVIDLPRIPIKFDVGGWKVDTVIAGPNLDLTSLGVPIKRELEVRQGLDLQGGTQVVLELDMTKIDKSEQQAAADAAVSVLENRVNFTGATEAVVQPARVGNDYRVLVELPGVSDTEQAVALVGQTAQLEFREFVDPASAAGSIPTMENTKATGLGGDDLKSAVVDTQNPTSPMVAITFTPEGAKKFSDLTNRLVGQPLAVFLDNVPLTAPTVQSVIRDGRAVINGSFTIESAKQLALQLSAGALPVPIKVVEQRTIGATLGQDSVDKSLVAGSLGLVLVMLYMLLNYRKLGLVADIALILYTLFSLALIIWIPITLTLAGIAGLILSIGMAVDANILIFERLREELRRGSKIRAAIEIGFDRAWPSIRDSNISTLITCIILYLFGTGTVRGFALTLGLGVLVSMFTAVVVTRTFLRLLYGGGRFGSQKAKFNPQLSRYQSARHSTASTQGSA
jgi:preprotein translocase subunit SecD